jgi:hypothetical protein
MDEANSLEKEIRDIEAQLSNSSSIDNTLYLSQMLKEKESQLKLARHKKVWQAKINELIKLSELILQAQIFTMDNKISEAENIYNRFCLNGSNAFLRVRNLLQILRTRLSGIKLSANSAMVSLHRFSIAINKGDPAVCEFAEAFIKCTFDIFDLMRL